MMQMVIMNQIELNKNMMGHDGMDTMMGWR